MWASPARARSPGWRRSPLPAVAADGAAPALSSAVFGTGSPPACTTAPRRASASIRSVNAHLLVTGVSARTGGMASDSRNSPPLQAPPLPAVLFRSPRHQPGAPLTLVPPARPARPRRQSPVAGKPGAGLTMLPGVSLGHAAPQSKRGEDVEAALAGAAIAMTLNLSSLGIAGTSTAWTIQPVPAGAAVGELVGVSCPRSSAAPRSGN